MPEVTLKFDAILFDMDGTLVDSTEGVEGAWQVFKQTYPNIDVHEILSNAHGVRTVENLRLHCGIEDTDELEREAQRFEQEIVDSSTRDGRKGIVMLPGVQPIIAELAPGGKLPKPCWAIVTSATRVYASAALKQVGIDLPDAFVTSEDVSQGKPQPDPYLLGAKKCGVPPERCLVLEDAPAGVKSGRAAGCTTLAVVTSHSREQMDASGANYVVPNLSSVSMRRIEDGVEVVIRT